MWTEAGHADGTPGSLAGEAFTREVRRALHHLYSPNELRKSSLLQLLGLDPREGAAALRDILLKAIEALRPAGSVPLRAKPWRTYNTLLHLYVQQFAQAEVATALALSTRQLRRQEHLAVLALADYLASRYGLEGAAGGGEAPAEGGDTPSREQELAWLERSLPTEPADIGELLQAVLKIVDPLVQALEVRVECQVPPSLPRVAAQVASIRQALLNTLTATVRRVPGGQVTIEAGARGDEVGISVRAAGQGPATAAEPAGQMESLAMARQLVGLSGGWLEVEAAEGSERPLTVYLALPAAEQVAVLVVDDNADTLQLFQRYLVGTRYPFIGARAPQQALALAEELTPQIVVLDVMLPGLDGWELLGHLREHPKTRGVPVIVCSILPEEQLALALGAAAFLRKPVSRAAFLAALDRQAELLKGSG